MAYAGLALHAGLFFPDGFTVFDAYASRGTVLRTEPAAGAVVGHGVLLRSHTVFVEKPVDRAALQHADRAGAASGELLPRFDESRGGVNLRSGVMYYLQSLLLFGNLEHVDEVLRHDYLRNSHILLADLTAKLLRVASGISYVAPAGQHEVHLSAPSQLGPFQQFLNGFRNLPAVRRADYHPGPVGFDWAVIMPLYSFKQIEHCISRAFGYLPCSILAVSRSGKVQNHRRIPLFGLFYDYSAKQPCNQALPPLWTIFLRRSKIV